MKAYKWQCAVLLVGFAFIACAVGQLSAVMITEVRTQTNAYGIPVFTANGTLTSVELTVEDVISSTNSVSHNHHFVPASLLASTSSTSGNHTHYAFNIPTRSGGGLTLSGFSGSIGNSGNHNHSRATGSGLTNSKSHSHSVSASHVYTGLPLAPFLGGSDFSISNPAITTNGGGNHNHTWPGGKSFENGSHTHSVSGSWRTTTVFTYTPPSLGGAGANFGNVRVGATASADVTMTNTGGGTLTNGSYAAASGQFSGGPASGISLGDGSNTTRAYQFSPTAVGADSQGILLNSNFGSTTATLSGTGVGPQFANPFSLGGTVDFGKVKFGTSGTVLLDLQNVTPVDLGDSLTGLTITDYSITGPDSSSFDVPSFSSFVISAGSNENLPLMFSDSGSQGARNALLTLYTDEGATFGDTGNSFQFNLSATVTPEPSSIMLLGMGILGLLRYSRLRRQGKNS